MEFRIYIYIYAKLRSINDPTPFKMAVSEYDGDGFIHTLQLVQGVETINIPRNADYIENVRVRDVNGSVSDMILDMLDLKLHFVRDDPWLVLPYTGLIPLVTIWDTSDAIVTLQYDAWFVNGHWTEPPYMEDVKLKHPTSTIHIHHDRYPYTVIEPRDDS